MANKSPHVNMAKKGAQQGHGHAIQTANSLEQKKIHSTVTSESLSKAKSLENNHDNIIEAAVYEEDEVDDDEDGPVTFDPVGRNQASKPFQQSDIPILDAISDEMITFDGDVTSKRRGRPKDKRKATAVVEAVDTRPQTDRQADMRLLVMEINGDCSV